MRAVFHYDAGPRLAARLAALAGDGFMIDACPEEADARLATLLPEAEVLLHVLKPATAEVISRAPKLRLIQKIGVGVNTIDLAAARARGIAVANMPGTNTPAVAEAAFFECPPAGEEIASVSPPAASAVVQRGRETKAVSTPRIAHAAMTAIKLETEGPSAAGRSSGSSSERKSSRPSSAGSADTAAPGDGLNQFHC